MIKTTCKTIYLNVAVLESILKDHITMKFSENIIEKISIRPSDTCLYSLLIEFGRHGTVWPLSEGK